MMDEALPRRVPARAGIEWVTGAFKLFFKSPLMLSAAAAILLGALIILQLVPLAGPALAEILTPLLVAGFMRAYRAIDEGSEPEFPHFAAGFQTKAIPLATVGAIYLGLVIAIVTLMKSLGVDYEGMMTALQQGAATEQLAAELQGKELLLLLGLGLAIPAIAATWFAPALILFGNASPLQAMGLSLKACAKNWLAMSVNGLAILPVLLLAAIPVFGLLILLPVLLGTAYLGYQGMFAFQDSGFRGQDSE